MINGLMSKLVKLAGLDPVENIRNVLGSSPSEATNGYELLKSACGFDYHRGHKKNRQRGLAKICPCGGIGRHCGLKSHRPLWRASSSLVGGTKCHKYLLNL